MAPSALWSRGRRTAAWSRACCSGGTGGGLNTALIITPMAALVASYSGDSHADFRSEQQHQSKDYKGPTGAAWAFRCLWALPFPIAGS